MHPAVYVAPTVNITKLSGGRKVVTTGGTRERVSSSSVRITGIVIQALRTNSGNVMVGGDDVDVTAGSESGTELVPGQIMVIEVDDLNRVWIDCDNSGEGINYTLLYG